MSSPNITKKKKKKLKKLKKLKNSRSSSIEAWHRIDLQVDAPWLMKKSKSKKEKTRYVVRFRNIT
jgi:hypothetical protein